MSTARVNCPSCRRLFEVDEEFRGEEVECPRCSTPFQIPLAGAEGVLLVVEPEESEREPGAFDISCPYCRTVFELPENFRGELAECAECQEVFVIPKEGNRGLRFDEAGHLATPPGAGPARPPVGSGMSAAVSTPVEETSSGILIEPSLSSAAASRTATVRLSRREVVANLMKPSASSLAVEDLDEEAGSPNRLRPSIPIRRMGDEEEEEELAPALDGKAQGSFIPLEGDDGLPPSHRAPAATTRPPIRFSDMPRWVPGIDLDSTESIVEFEAGTESSLVPHYVLTGIPVFLIPVAVILAQFIHPAASASACFLVALIFWGTFAAAKLPTLARKILILTTQRAIMADPREVVDIDIE